MILLIAFPISAFAESGMITSGYTEDGIYYEVYGEQPSIQPLATGGTYVVREVIFDGKVTPERELFWQEAIGYVPTEGTLYLTSYLYNRKENKTYATYEGYLHRPQ
jgi:hypothetical protein